MDSKREKRQIVAKSFESKKASQKKKYVLALDYLKD